MESTTQCPDDLVLSTVMRSQEATNGTSPQSFPYPEFYNYGVCHMDLEDFNRQNAVDSPSFGITSNAAVSPQTWIVTPSTLSGWWTNEEAHLRAADCLAVFYQLPFGIL